MIRETKTYLVEIKVDSAPAFGKKYKFPQNLGALMDATIYGIEIYSGDDINASPTGKPVVSFSGCKSTALTIYNKSNEQIRQIPLVDLMPTKQGGIIREFVPFVWNSDTSFFELFATTGVNLNDSYILNFIYLK